MCAVDGIWQLLEFLAVYGLVAVKQLNSSFVVMINVDII